MTSLRLGLCSVTGPSTVPMATVGVDTNHDGRANYTVTGPDLNRDGIPDEMQRPAWPSRMTSSRQCSGIASAGVPMATTVTAQDLKHDGLPDALQRTTIATPVVTAVHAPMWCPP